MLCEATCADTSHCLNNAAFELQEKCWTADFRPGFAGLGQQLLSTASR